MIAYNAFTFFRGSLQLIHRNQQGQTFVEYSLLVAMIIVLILSTINIYTNPLVDLYQQILTTFEHVTRHLSF